MKLQGNKKRFETLKCFRHRIWRIIYFTNGMLINVLLKSPKIFRECNFSIIIHDLLRLGGSTYYEIQMQLTICLGSIRHSVFIQEIIKREAFLYSWFLTHKIILYMILSFYCLSEITWFQYTLYFTYLFVNTIIDGEMICERIKTTTQNQTWNISFHCIPGNACCSCLVCYMYCYTYIVWLQGVIRIKMLHSFFRYRKSQSVSWFISNGHKKEETWR